MSMNAEDITPKGVEGSGADSAELLSLVVHDDDQIQDKVDRQRTKKTQDEADNEVLDQWRAQCDDADDAEPEPELTRKERLKAWCKKYFMEGQILSPEQQAKLDAERATMSKCEKYRKYWAALLPAAVVWTVWLAVFSYHDLFYLYNSNNNEAEVKNYKLAVMMAFGGVVAGATSEGGGAVAYPVMTLAFDIDPEKSRDFSLMIQSIGMTSASVTILLMKVQLEYHALVLGTISAVFGCCFGLEFIAPQLPNTYAKLYFVTIFAAFAVALYLLNRSHDRQVFDTIQNWKEGKFYGLFQGKAFALLLAGFVGGILTSIGGSGLDIATFAMLTLYFRVSEKIATPTSVVLMGINTCVGFFYRAVVQDDIHFDTWRYFACAAPVVCLGAPIGSFLGSHFHRLVLAWMVYVLDFAQFSGALFVLQPWNNSHTKYPVILCSSAIAILILGASLFYYMQYCGSALLKEIEAAKAEKKESEEENSDDPESTIEGPPSPPQEMFVSSTEPAVAGPNGIVVRMPEAMEFDQDLEMDKDLEVEGDDRR